MALDWQEVHIPLAAGVDTEKDPRALEAPGLAVCKNAEFDEVGGLQLRKPYSSIGANILGGGTISAARRIVSFGDELLLFTKSSLYSWSASDSAWVLKSTHLAAKIDEKSVFARTSDQTECDRAELANVVVYTWVDISSSNSVYLAAADKTTGAVLLTPTIIETTGVSRPSLVALTSVIHLYWVSGTTLKGLVITPTSLAASAAAVATSIGTSVNSFYDVVVQSNVAYIAYRRSTTTSYEVKAVTAALSVTSDTKARTCDGPIAISASPSGTHLQIIRANSTNIQGDLLLRSDLSSVHINQAVGTVASTPVYQIAAAHRSVQNSSEYRCYVFWDYDETDDETVFQTKTNWVDTGNNLGTQADLVDRLAVVSRAFDRDGEVYVWLGFAGQSSATSMTEELGFRAQLQNTYFLYRDDGLLVAKAAGAKAGGFASVEGHLPHVQSLGGDVYAWCGMARRVIDLGGDHTGYEARVPRDIQITFDSDDARRCARFGETLYIAGGQVVQYDGVGLTEVGFHLYPWYFDALDGGAGAKDAGTFALKATYSWLNAKDEFERSTTATTTSVVLATASKKIAVSVAPLQVTLKSSFLTRPRSNAAIEIWGTLANPTVDAPFYLLTSKDPSDETNPNRYLANDITASFASSFEDELSDALAARREINPENGALLESLCPPAASIIAATQDRLFLAGVAGEPNRIHYSRLRTEGEVASFHDALTVEVPTDGGPITALAVMDETLYAFCETSVYALPGDGFDNAGGGQNYGPARRVATDTGAVSAEAVALTPGGLIYKSRKGWHMLSRGGGVQYIGGKVQAFDSDTVKAIHVVEAQSQVRCLTGSRLLMFDYNVGEWSEWTVTDGLGACVWNSTYHYVATASVKAEQSTYSAVDYALDVETAWIKLSGLQGYANARWLHVLGEYRSAHCLRVRVARDYQESDASGVTWFDDKYWTVSPTTVGGPLQVQHGPSQTKGQSIKVRLTAYAAGSTTDAPSGEALKLTGLSLEYGVLRGLNRRLPAAQKQGGS